MSSPARAVAAPSGRNTAVLTVLLCLFVTVLEGFDLQAAGVAAPALRAEIALSDQAAGWFLSSSTFGLMIGALFGGRLADTFGRKRTLIFAVAAFGAASILTGLAQGFGFLIAARGATGLGLGAALPILIALISENAPGKWKNTAIAIAYAGMPFGGAIASAVTLAGGGAEWRMVFFVGGVAPLLIVPLLAVFLPDSVRFRAAQRAGERHGLAKALAAEGRLARTLLLWGAFFVTLMVLYLLLNWLPTLMVRQGFSAAEASTLQIVFNLAGAAGGFLGGYAMDRFRPWIVAAVFFVAAAAAMLALASVPASLGLTMAVIAAVGVAIMGTQAILYAFAPSVYPVAVRGAGVGAAVAVGRAGSVAGPLIAGALLQAGAGGGAVLMLAFPCLAAGGVLAVWLLAAVRPTTD